LFPQDLYILKGKNLNSLHFFYEPDNQKLLGKTIVLGEKQPNTIQNINNKLRIWDTKLSSACLKKLKAKSNKYIFSGIKIKNNNRVSGLIVPLPYKFATFF
jgi:hypothetical protein